MIEQIQRIDDTVLDFIYLHARSDMLDLIMPVISKAGNLGMIWIITGFILLCIKKQRTTGIIILTALIISAVFGDLIIKNIFARPRPFSHDPDILLLIPEPRDHSFPSGHTVSSFASAAALFMVNIYAGVFGIIAACMISFSRIYLYVHYPSDIIAGILLGSMSFYASRKSVALISNSIVKRRGHHL